MFKLLKYVSIVVIGASCLLPRSAEAAPSFDAEVSIWDSSVAPSSPAPTVIPVGGSGQINGNFVVEDFDITMDPGADLQLGIRAQKRFFPEFWPNMDAVYFVDPGESSPDRAKWNIDIHIDLGGGPLLDDMAMPVPRENAFAGTGKAFADFDFYLEIDLNPAVGNPFAAGPEMGKTLLLDTFGGTVPGDTILYQQSWNPNFDFIDDVLTGGFPQFMDSGEYDIRLYATEAGMPFDEVASVAMKVVVTPEPATYALLGSTLGLVALRRRNRATA